MTNDLVEWLTVCIVTDTRLLPAIISVNLSRRLSLEIARNRRILERHLSCEIVPGDPFCARCTETYGPVGQSWPCDEIRDLTSVYADRPGYRPEWGPTDAG
ncbi:hypothetical protein GCM10009765_58730 [Fodinicola feengrottensis]|uniref:Uncharacterized protein n=1 Tax=Fodinicola feengrottensis TaxID=435914 RepID=A0ABN2IAL2_9ACTN